LAVPVPTAWPREKAPPPHRAGFLQQQIVTEYPGLFARECFIQMAGRADEPYPAKAGGPVIHWYEYPPRTSSPTSPRTFSGCAGRRWTNSVFAWRFSRRNIISVARREAVARLDEFVGPKY